MVHGIARKDVTLILKHRQATGPFTSQADLVRRTGISQAAVERLARADVFQSLGQHRRQALWEALAQEASGHDLPLFAGLHERDDDAISLPELKDRDEVFADYQSTGLSLRQHPLHFHREKLGKYGVVPMAALQELRDGRRVEVAGLVILRQRPGTAKGITFVTLEDETGVANLVIHKRIWDRYYSLARTSPAWIARGRLQRSGEVTHLVVDKIEDLSKTLTGIKNSSRDFR